MKEVIFTFVVVILSGLYLQADNYYWVNNGGDWSDYENHWSMNSGDTVNMHPEVPGPDDDVFFDAASFDEADQLVALDTSYIEVNSIDWTGVTNEPEFYASNSDTLAVNTNFILSENMVFNVLGKIFFEGAPGNTIEFDTKGKVVRANVYIDRPGDTMVLLSGIEMPEKHLYLYDGILDGGAETIVVKSFNGDEEQPLNITGAPVLTNADSIVCKQSFFLHDNLDVSGLHSDLVFPLQVNDSCYVSFGNNVADLDVYVTGNKKLFMQGPINTTGNIVLNFSGHFISNGYNISCVDFLSPSGLERNINLNSSTITLRQFQLEPNLLTLNSSGTNLHFSAGSECVYKTKNLSAAFDAFIVSVPGTMRIDSDVQVDSLALTQGLRFLLKQGITLETNKYSGSGTCGDFIDIRTYCESDTSAWPVDSCVVHMPVFSSPSGISADYLKISHVEAQGGLFDATNSYAVGDATGWTITAPAQQDTLYWIGHTGQWNNPGNWSLNSGGVAQSCLPNPESHVVFDDASFNMGDTLKNLDKAWCRSMDWSALTKSVVWDGDKDLYIQEGVMFNVNIDADFSGNMIFETNQPADTFDITSNGMMLNAPFVFNGNATWQFMDNLTSEKQVVFNGGGLLMQNSVFSLSGLISDSDQTRVLSIDTANIYLTGNNDVWVMDNTNLSFSADTSTIYMISSAGDIQSFQGDNLAYCNLDAQTENISIRGSNSFSHLHLHPGNTVAFEPNTITSVDSLTANGSCDEPIMLHTGSHVDTAQILKTGYDTLQVNSLVLNNITADTTGGVRFYEAFGSIPVGNVSGWTFADTLTGQVYVWQGNTQNWSDTVNWKVGGVQASCLPGLQDTVVIDESIMEVAVTDTIRIDKIAGCRYLNVSDMDSVPVYFIFENSLNTVIGAEFNDSVSLEYENELTLNNLFDKTDGLVVMPESENASLNFRDAYIEVNLLIDAYNANDTVNLMSNVNFRGLSGINLVSGTFHTHGDTIEAGMVRSYSNAPKVFNMEHSLMQNRFYYSVQKPSVIDVYADSSRIVMVENSYANAFFGGGGQQYYNLELYPSENQGSVDDYLISVYGSNTFHHFSVFPGGTVQMEKGTNQTVDSLYAIGTCPDRIRFTSSEEGTQYTFTKAAAYEDTLKLCVIRDMDILPSGVAMYSNDAGGNGANLSFIAGDPVEADFTIPYPACVGTPLTFVNNSYSAESNPLDYEWIIQDIDTLTTDNLTHTFNTQGDYFIRLKATDPVNNCVDSVADTLQLIKHTATISGSPQNLTVCHGDTLSFSASSNHAVDYEFYVNNVPLGLGGTVDYYETDTLSDGDMIYVETVLDGCVEYSDTLIPNIHPLPSVSVNVTPAGAELCEGDTIFFSASGADKYQYFINDTAVTSMSDNTDYMNAAIEDSAFVQVYGKNNTTGCEAWSADEFTVRVYPNPVVNLTASVDPPEVCDGEPLEFYANGGDTYEYFINGISQGVPGASDNFTTSVLSDGDLVTVMGYDIHGCSALSDFINVTVNPSPSLVLSSDDADNSICEGDEITFTGSGAAEYLFFIDSTPLGAWTADDFIATDTLSHQQTIGLAGRIGDCYDTTTNIMVNVYPVLELTASILEICEGEEITFTATGDTVYQFFVDGVAAGPVSHDSVFITSSLADGQIVTVQGTPNACLPEGLEVTVHPTPVPELTCNDADTSVCEGQEISFTASGANTYEFFVNGVSQGPESANTYFGANDFVDGDTVTMSATSEYGCFSHSTDTLVVEIRPYPTVSLVTSDPTEICSGDVVTVEGSGAEQYEFYVSGVSEGAPSPDNTHDLDDLNNLDQVSLEGTTDGCTSTAPEVLTYTVFGVPNVSIDAISPLSVCQGETITLLATGATEYEFLVNGVSQGAPSTEDEFSSDAFSDGDMISVIGYQNICSDTSDNSIEVDVNEIPDVSFNTSMTAAGVCVNDTIEFTASGANEFEFFVDGISQGAPATGSDFIMTDFVEGQQVTVSGYNNACMRPSDTAYTVHVNRVYVSMETDAPIGGVCGQQEITATASGADLYEFFVDSSSVGAPSSDSVYAFTPEPGGHTIAVVGTDENIGCSEMSPSLYIDQTEVPIITTEGDAFCEHDSLQLYSSTEAGNQWFMNGQVIPGATEDTYYTHTGGIYTLQVSNGISGGVYSAGTNTYGQLGTGNTTQAIEPALAATNQYIVDVEAGRMFTIALSDQGEVLAWGNNDYGSLGTGTYEHAHAPVAIGGIDNAVDIASGYYHALALLSDSTLVSWGKNDDGQCGYGNFAASNFPTPVIDLDSIVSVDAGESHSLALDASGHVYAWGRNHMGQLGTGDVETKNSPVQVNGLSGIIKIACGANHNMALDADGNVFVWGANTNGQLGTGDYQNRIIPALLVSMPGTLEMACGKQHSLLYNEYGNLYATGNNAYGQLGLPGETGINSPQKLSLSGVIQLEASPSGSYAIRNDHSLWAWGLNTSAQLMLGASGNVSEPAMSEHVTAVSDVSGGLDFAATVKEDALVCESNSVTIDMLDVPDVQIQQDGLVLYVEAGVSWQWFLNGSAIPGATESEFTVSVEGDYTVLMEFENGCSAETEPFEFSLSIEDCMSEGFVSISPNPSDGKILLTMDMPQAYIKEITSWELVTPDGRIIVANDDIIARKEQVLKFDGLKPGVYYLKLNNDVHPIVKKMVIL